MPDHYFTADPRSAHDLRTVTLRCGTRLLVCQTDAGVFSRQHMDPGSELLLKALPKHVEGRVLDLGCGWGALGLSIACLHPDVALTLCDINARALALAEQNFARNGLHAAFVCSDGLEAVQGTFSLVVTNPPIRAGKAIIYRLFAESRAHLVPGGMLLVVIRKQQGAPSALTYLQTLFDRAQVAQRSAGYWVIRCEVQASA